MTWFSSKLTPVGIDVGGRFIKAAQLARTREGYQLVAASELPLAHPNMAIDLEAARGIRQALLKQGFRGRRIVLAVPNMKLQTGMLDVPASPMAPVDTLIRAELHRSCDLPVESFEMAHWKLPSAEAEGEGSSVMAVAARTADLMPLMDIFEDADFHVKAIDIQSLALLRACTPMIERLRKEAASDGLTAIVDLGWNEALMVIVRDGQILQQRTHAASGAAPLRQAIIERFGLRAEVADQLLTEVSLQRPPTSDVAESVHAAWTRNMLVRHTDGVAAGLQQALASSMQRYPSLRLDRVIVCGGGARRRGLESYLKARLGAEVLVARAQDMAQCGSKLGDLASTPALACAIGLAQWAD